MPLLYRDIKVFYFGDEIFYGNPQCFIYSGDVTDEYGYCAFDSRGDSIVRPKELLIAAMAENFNDFLNEVRVGPS